MKNPPVSLLRGSQGLRWLRLLPCGAGLGCVCVDVSGLHMDVCVCTGRCPVCACMDVSGVCTDTVRVHGYVRFVHGYIRFVHGYVWCAHGHVCLYVDMSAVRMDTPAVAAHCSSFPKLPAQCSWDFEPQNPRQSQVSAHQPALGPAVVPALSPPQSHASLGAQAPSAPPSLAAGA